MQLVHKIMTHPSRKKIFISLALVSFVGFLLTLSFVVWLSFGIFGLVKDGAATLTGNSREVVEKNIGKVSTFKVGPDCVSQLQALSSVNVFFGKPLQDTFEKIKTACLPAGATGAGGGNTEAKPPETQNEADWK